MIPPRALSREHPPTREGRVSLARWRAVDDSSPREDLGARVGYAVRGPLGVTFPSGLRALNHPEFRLYFTGQVLSQVGTWMQSVAQSWLVLQLTGSPLRLGLINTFQFLPMLLFSVFSGAV